MACVAHWLKSGLFLLAFAVVAIAVFALFTVIAIVGAAAANASGLSLRCSLQRRFRSSVRRCATGLRAVGGSIRTTAVCGWRTQLAIHPPSHSWRTRGLRTSPLA